jgi:hypothetical protein
MSAEQRLKQLGESSANIGLHGNDLANSVHLQDREYIHSQISYLLENPPAGMTRQDVEDLVTKGRTNRVTEAQIVNGIKI